jgi:glycosyltransferase involved in cell wall biosynthesis
MRRLPSIVSVDATPKQFDDLGLAYGHATGPAWLERVKFRLNQSCFTRAAKIVAFSHWVEASLVADYGIDGHKIEVVRPGLDVTRAPEVDRRGRQGSRPLCVLFVGGDFDRKGGPTLLAAMDLLEDLDVKLEVVTRSTVAETERRKVHNGLTAHSPELLDLYEQADVFCLPTRADALGLVFAEAGAAGLPLIGTDTGAVTEIVRDGETGLIVPADDVEALAAALRRLLTDEDQRLGYGAAARDLVRAEYDENVTSGRITALLHEVAGQGQSRKDQR